MQLSTRVLGQHAVRQITERSTTALVTIGRDRFTRGDLARVGCFNYLAAANLATAIDTHLTVKSVRDLFETVPPAELIVPRVGVIAYAVLGALFELAEIGGEQPLEAWIAHHRAPGAPEDGFVTISHMKHQAAALEAARETTRRRRRRSRRYA